MFANIYGLLRTVVVSVYLRCTERSHDLCEIDDLQNDRKCDCVSMCAATTVCDNLFNSCCRAGTLHTEIRRDHPQRVKWAHMLMKIKRTNAGMQDRRQIASSNIRTRKCKQAQMLRPVYTRFARDSSALISRGPTIATTYKRYRYRASWAGTNKRESLCSMLEYGLHNIGNDASDRDTQRNRERGTAIRE